MKIEKVFSLTDECRKKTASSDITESKKTEKEEKDGTFTFRSNGFRVLAL